MALSAPNRFHRQRGQSLLETALTVVIIFVVAFWIFEICGLFYTYTVIADAANEGVRYAVVHPGLVPDDPNVQARVLQFARMSMHNVSGISTSVAFPDSAPSTQPPKRVRVTVSYAYVPWLPQFLGTSPAMHAYAEGRMIVE